MKLKYIFSLLLLSLFNLSAFAQKTAKIYGKVMELNTPIESAIVLITSENEKDIISYTMTNKSGDFVFDNVDYTHAKKICVKMIGYVPQITHLKQGQENYIFYLDTQSIELKDVTIKATSIKDSKDTLNYLTSVFAQKNDITISDVLKRMPGIEVSENGHIKYQGQEIKDFYVDGSNIMGSRYNMAINSIKHTDVGSVDVIENHQSIKMFEDLLHSNSVALNLKLKEKAKNKWVGILEAGIGGAPFSWEFNANTMRFAEKFQCLNTFKSNNIGHNLSNSSVAPSLLFQEDEWSKPFVGIPAKYTTLDFMEGNKTLFNTSHLLSLNSLFKLWKNITITPQIELSYNRFKRESYQQQAFFYEDKTWEVVKNEYGKWGKWLITPSIRIEANTKKYYLNNTVTAIIDRNSQHIGDIGTHPNQQSASNHLASVKNVMDLMMRIGKRTFGIHSYTSFGNSPQTLCLDSKMSSINEQIKSSYIYSKNAIRQTFTLGRLTLGIEEGLTIAHHKLRSTLTGLATPHFNSNQENQNTYNMRTFFVDPTLSLDLSTFKFSISTPISYNYYDTTDKIDAIVIKKMKWRLGASLSAQWIMNKQWSISGNIFHRPISNTPYMLFNKPILSTYPFLQVGALQYNKESTNSLRATLKFKDIYYGLLGNMSYMYQRTKSDLLPIHNIENEYMIYGSIFYPHESCSKTLMGNVSYMISSIKGSITLKGLYTISRYQFMQNKALNATRVKNTQFSLHLFSTPIHLLQLNYFCSLSLLHYKQENTNKDAHQKFNQKFSMSISPFKNLSIEFIADHHYHKLSGSENSKSICLLDLNFLWDISTQWKFKLATTNILNNKEFINTFYSPTSILNQRYELRPTTILFSLTTLF